MSHEQEFGAEHMFADDDYDDDCNSSIIDPTTMSQDEKNDLEENPEIFEKGKHRIYRRIVKTKSDGSKVSFIKKVTMYSTRTTSGSCIRDPVCGVFSTDKVGTNSEKLYFKVRMADISTEDRGPVTLFYDSPEGYERHQFTQVSMNIKNAWHKRKVHLTGVEIPRFEGRGSIEIK